MREIIEKLLEKIGKDSSGSVVFDDSAKNPVEIKKENFHDISGKKTGKKVAFVDGGNLELLKSPSLSLFFNRIYYTIYQNTNLIPLTKNWHWGAGGQAYRWLGM